MTQPKSPTLERTVETTAKKWGKFGEPPAWA